MRGLRPAATITIVNARECDFCDVWGLYTRKVANLASLFRNLNIGGGTTTAFIDALYRGSAHVLD